MPKSKITTQDVRKAISLIREAPFEIKKELFEKDFAALEKARLNWLTVRDLPASKQSRLNPSEEQAFLTCYEVSRIFRLLTGYNPQWAFDYFAESNNGAGRKAEYRRDDYEFFAWLTHQLVTTGQGKVKKESAYRLVAYLADKKRKPESSDINSGLQRAIAESYREFEKEKSDEVEPDILKAGHWFLYLLAFCNLSTKPSRMMMKRDSTDAAVIEAFRALVGKLIGQLRELAPTIKEKDNYWRKGMFGWVPLALDKTYSDPLDFLFDNYPVGLAERRQRGQELMEFINAAMFWRDAPPDFKQVEISEENLITCEEIFRTATRPA
jgi:hypothetical protein